MAVARGGLRGGVVSAAASDAAAAPSCGFAAASAGCALEDQGLLSDKEIEELKREVDKVSTERVAQTVVDGRQKQ